MSFTIEQQLQSNIVPLQHMNGGYIDLYVQWYREGKVLSPSKRKLAEAAIALQEAYARMHLWEPTEETVWSLSDEEMITNAVAAFKHGEGHPIHNGVRRDYIPHGAVEGDDVLIHNFFLKERAVLEGKVIKVIEYPKGIGFVIEQHKVIDRHLMGQPRSKYISLWVSGDPTAMSGFVYI